MEKITNAQIDNEILNKILFEISELKDKFSLLNSQNLIIPEWIPRSEVMKFLGYGDTQIREFEIKNNLVTSKIGNRKFFNRISLIKVLENNIQL